MTATDHEPRKLLAREDRRAQILGAAAAAFARTGHASTSMAEVAREAGVTRVLLYRHFASKEELYRAVLDDTLTLLGEAWESRDPDNLAAAAVRAHLRAARESPDGYRLLWRHADTEPEFTSHAQQVRDLLVSVADQAVGTDIRPQLRAWAMSTLVSAIVEATLAWLDHGRPDDDEAFIEAAATGLVRQVTGWAEVAI
ncbi:MAG: TetR/AcrR family transcriptional regulator [Actinomycetota bacterium]